MASSFNPSSCQLKCFLSPPRPLKCFLSSSRQLKYSFSPCRQFKYSSSSSSQLKYSFSPSRQFKYSSSPCCQLKDSSSPSPPWEYHVFLSFRFETRHSFATQLLQALKDTGMHVFFDEQKLEKGKEFLESLSRSIAASKLSIIILSADYASSPVCLLELSKIMDCKRNQQQMVIPIFYHVDQSDVKNIGGSFKKSFDAHESKGLHQVQQRKEEFAQVGKLTGIHIKGDKPETEDIKHIVEYVMLKLRHQVFLSFAEDTHLNFTHHLLKALEKTGINVFSGMGEQFSQSSDLSIIVLSEDYVSSESCKDQLSDIMRRSSQNHIVLPIFYHVKISVLEKLGELPGKEHFAKVAGLQGFPIRATSDRHDHEYIEDVVQCVIKELNRKSRSISDGLVGIDDQRETILRLIEEKDSRIIGLWGASGMGKTTLAEAVYNEISPTFEGRYFLHDVRGEIEKQGRKSLRNELFSELLNEKDFCINTPSVGSTITQQRLNNMKVIVVLDNVSDFDQINFMGVKHFGEGSKIIVTSTDRQVLKNGGADKIYEVKKLKKEHSLQLFSTFAFKRLNPPPHFRDVSYKFLEHAEGIPFNLITYGSAIYTKSIEECESELDMLKEYPNQKILHIFMRHFDELGELEKNIFLDIACFLKGESKIKVEKILSCLYKGAVSGISNLVNKSLLRIDSYGRISMHDIRQEMGKFIARHQGSEDPENYTRLWSPKDVKQVLKYNKVNKSLKGIKVHMIRGEDLLPGFENMLNLRYIELCTMNEKLFADTVDNISLPYELRYLCWDCFPFKSLSPSFNPKNLVVLELHCGYMDQLWNEDYQDLVNLRVIDLSWSKTLKKIPNLSGAINLQSICCCQCENLVELPYLSHLVSLESLDLTECLNLRKIPSLSGAINLKSLDCWLCKSLVEPPGLPNSISELNLSYTGIEQVADSIRDLVGLRNLSLSHTRVDNVSSNISKLESLCVLDVAHCESLKTLPKLPRYLWRLDASDCSSLEQVSFTDYNLNSFHSLHDGDGDGAPGKENVSMLFSNCRSLNQDSVKNIAANAMLQIQSLAQRWVMREGISGAEYEWDSLFCCFPGNEVSANVFYYESMNYWLNLKITRSGCSGGRSLAFAVYFVADLSLAEGNPEFICKYQLTAASGEKLTRESRVSGTSHRVWSYKGDHVFILFIQDMIIIDNNYEEASFEFNVKDRLGRKYKVEKCGVNILYVDAESFDDK